MGDLFGKPKPPPAPEIPEPEPMPIPDEAADKVAAQRRVATKLYSKGRESTFVSGKTKLN